MLGLSGYYKSRSRSKRPFHVVDLHGRSLCNYPVRPKPEKALGGVSEHLVCRVCLEKLELLEAILEEAVED